MDGLSTTQSKSFSAWECQICNGG